MRTVILVVKGVVKISKKGSTIVISIPRRNEKKEILWETQTIPILDLELVVIVGSRARISSGVLLMLSEAGIPVLLHGKMSDSFLMNPYIVKIAETRRRLYNIYENLSWRIAIGKSLIDGKLKGLVNLGRYLAYKDAEKGKDSKYVLEELTNIEKSKNEEVDDVRSVEELRLYEAKWSKRLWEILTTFIPSEYGFTGRDPKSKDPINSTINYTYAIIYSLCTHALIASGLDPYVGIIHSERAGKTSLTYDFSEMFKPIAIHAVIVASRQLRILTDTHGYLTRESLETVTKQLYRLLKKKHRKWKYSARGEIYAKAWELRQNIERGTPFKPFTYEIK